MTALREQFQSKLKTYMQEKDATGTATMRLILAALKDRDIAARTKGQGADGINEDEILSMMQTMIKQRRESVKMYNEGGRAELADREEAEIKIIEQFLPAQMDDNAIGAAVEDVVSSTGATGLKDMGAVMAKLREKYAGQMDFGKASAIVKDKLA